MTRKELYRKYLRSDHWCTLRKKKKAKADHCAICYSTEQLHVHHLFYKNLTDCDTSDLRVLCKRCHFLSHDLHKDGVFKFTTGKGHEHRFVVLKRGVLQHLPKSVTDDRKMVTKKKRLAKKKRLMALMNVL